MIEPPKFYTDARRQYDLMDIEVLGKFIVELGLHYRADVRITIEQLMTVAGTHQFPKQYSILYNYILNKRDELMTTSAAAAGGANDPNEAYQDTVRSLIESQKVTFELPRLEEASLASSVAYVMPKWLQGGDEARRLEEEESLGLFSSRKQTLAPKRFPTTSSLIAGSQQPKVQMNWRTNAVKGSLQNASKKISPTKRLDRRYSTPVVFQGPAATGTSPPRHWHWRPLRQSMGSLSAESLAYACADEDLRPIIQQIQQMNSQCLMEIEALEKVGKLGIDLQQTPEKESESKTSKEGELAEESEMDDEKQILKKAESQRFVSSVQENQMFMHEHSLVEFQSTRNSDSDAINSPQDHSEDGEDSTKNHSNSVSTDNKHHQKDASLIAMAHKDGQEEILFSEWMVL